MPSPSSLHTAHYWHGQLPVAFVFSVPGSREKSTDRPLAGATGENLDFALAYLRAKLPTVFASADRYAYRITNAYSTPIAKSLGHSSTEATDSQIITSENAARVLRDLEGCMTVILCGLKAQLLESVIRESGRIVACVWHTSNQALSGKFRAPVISTLSDSHARRKLRAQFWAKDLLHSL